MQIADKLGDPLLRSQYMCVAEAYLKLVEIELDGLAGHPLRPDPIAALGSRQRTRGLRSSLDERGTHAFRGR